jgi:hypothetical protein
MQYVFNAINIPNIALVYMDARRIDALLSTGNMPNRRGAAAICITPAVSLKTTP